MQKKLLAAAVLSALSGVVSAQSANVTLYGLAFAHMESAQATGGDSTAAPTLATAGGASSVRGVAANPLNTGTASSLNQNYTTTPADAGSRFRTTGSGAHFGLRGSEDLGNGLSAWFQMEMSTAAAMGSQGNATTSIGGFQGVTMRNTAVGLRSASWGSVFTGAWDTPINVSYLQGNLVPQLGVVNTLASQAGFFGANPLFGGGAYSATSMVTACSATTATAGVGVIAGSAATCLNAATQVDRRQTNTIQWWSPNWNGLELRAHVSPTTEAWPAANNNQAVTTAGGAAPGVIKPNIWGGSIAYSNGPLWIGGAYERKNDLLAAGVRLAGGFTVGNAGFGTNLSLKTDMNSSKDDTWRIGARYKFDMGGGSRLGIGARYEQQKLSMGYANGPIAANTVTAATGSVSGTGAIVITPGGAVVTGAASDLTGYTLKHWNISGSFETGGHSFLLEYFKANDMSISTASAAGQTPTGGQGTGSKRWVLGYNYAMSKRTNVQAYVVNTINDNNARYVGGVFFNLAPVSGADPKYYGLGMSHAF